MNREQTRREDDRDGSADNRQEENNGKQEYSEMRDERPHPEPDPDQYSETEENDDLQLRKRRSQPGDGRGYRPLPVAACGFEHRRFIDDYSPEELLVFREMDIGNLGGEFILHAKPFETYHHVGGAYHVGTNSLLRVSHLLEERQRDGECPSHLSVSLSSLHRAVRHVEKFFCAHFDLPVEPRMLLWLGDGLPAPRLTDIGQVAWELIRDYLISMGYDTDGPKKKKR